MRDSDLTTAKILIVDDQQANVRLLERILVTAGYRDLASTTDSRDVLEHYRTFQPDLILLDLLMPHLDGVAVLEELAKELPAGAFLPVLVLTADATLEAKRRALAAGAHDFLTKPFEQLEVVLRIHNLLNTRRLYLELEAQNRSLDQTVRERTERLLQSEKVATMGSLLAGVAHELNNPLAVLSGQAQLLRETVTEATLIRRAGKIGDAADRCVRIVRNFLALARQRPPERTEVSIPHVIQSAIELLAYELRTEGIEVALDVDTAVPTLWADPHQLHQVLVNLIANAQQAMRRGPQPRRLAISAHHDAARGMVGLTVADTGPGIPPDVRNRIFEPFFTTKPPGEGTGLGLSLCRGIIEEHGGTIDVDSEPGHGTRFTIELPVAVRPVAQSEAAAAADTLPSIGPKTMLVVDDEPEIAAVIAEALERDGHHADVATNGAMALTMLGQRRYDLVLSDTKMPVMDGETLFAELQRRDPTSRRRMIFLTGDVLSREKREFLEQTGVPFLTKPCDLGDVRRLVHRVVAQNASAGPSA